MGSLLNAEANEAFVAVVDAASVSLVREAVRAHAAEIGLERERAESLVSAASEVAHNQLAHARLRRGEVVVRSAVRRDTPLVEVVARDAGPGIADPTAAMVGRGKGKGKESGAGLGVGLSAAHRLADEMDVDVRWGECTEIRLRKYVSPLPRCEVAILARACAGETVLGDDASFSWEADGLLCAVADGLGHGPQARVAAGRAMEVVARSRGRRPSDIVEDCSTALLDTRGAVIAVARVDQRGRKVVQSGLGNVSSHLYRGRTSSRFGATSGVAGRAGPTPRINEETSALSGRHVLVLFTDGISSRVDLSGDLGLFREPPLVIAHRVLAKHGQSHDDALVLVATG